MLEWLMTFGVAVGAGVFVMVTKQSIEIRMLRRQSRLSFEMHKIWAETWPEPEVRERLLKVLKRQGVDDTR
jgi:hypothetical protein